MANDCTHHDHKMDLLGAVVQDILLKLMYWNSNCYEGLESGKLRWTTDIPLELLLRLVLTAEAAASLHVVGQQRGPIPRRRRNCHCPTHRAGWVEHIEMMGYNFAGM